jgi:2-polyprenyl-3-methyl-5-hydroxy-6-metoxy-1,4-benzoquinol methylase
MSQQTLDSVRQRFERDAQSFDAIYRLERSPLSRWFNTTFRKAVFERYDLTFKHAGDVTSKAVLDIGCGSGVYSVDFARRGARRVLGVDFSAGMLEIARREAKDHGVQGVCQFTQANFLDYPLTERFDVAIAIGVYDYLPDPLTFMKKMVKAVSPGGRIIGSFPGHSLIRKPLRRMRYRLTGRGDVYYYDEARVRQLAKDAGVKEVQVVHIRSSGTGYLLVGQC